jgi:pyridoxamine 5'-phosphate oxidase
MPLYDPEMSAAAPAPSDLLTLFQTWFAEAVAAGVPEPEVMALATATPDGRPSVRYVLYRGISGNGIRFFTNRESRKGEELAVNPRAAVVFFWNGPGLRQQIRLEGRTEPLSPAEDDAYFAARPRGHQLAAKASPQSRPIPYGDLLDRYAALERAHPDRDVPRPAYWGGFRLVPDAGERWIAQDNRLHRRIRYRPLDGRWIAEELGP